MPDERTLTDLIGRAYDAAIGNEDWTVLVEQLMRATGGKAALLRWRDRPVATSVTISMDLSLHEIYDAYYHKLDPLWPLILSQPPGSAIDDRALMPAPMLEQTDFYREFMRPNGLEAGLSWYALDAAAQPVVLYIVPPSQQMVATDEALRLLGALAPHLQRAVTIEGHLAAAAPRPARQRADLSRRERDCLARIARGTSSKGIARQLALSVDTVNEYVGSAMRKLHASSRTEAVATALLLGLLNL